MKLFSALVRSARHYSAQPLPKRFYKEVSVVGAAAEDGDGEEFEICLDHRKLRTPARKVLRVPSYPLALAIAAEWDAQEEDIRMGKMHLHGLAVTAQVSRSTLTLSDDEHLGLRLEDNPTEETKEGLVSQLVDHLLPADTILYHSGEGGALGEREEKGWGGVLGWAEEVHGLRFSPTTSIAPPDVPDESRAWLRRHLAFYDFPALHGYVFGAEALKSVLLMFGTVEHWLRVPEATSLSLAEQEFCEERWGSVEWAHDAERLEVEARTAAAALFVHFHASRYSAHDLPHTTQSF